MRERSYIGSNSKWSFLTTETNVFKSKPVLRASDMPRSLSSFTGLS